MDTYRILLAVDVERTGPDPLSDKKVEMLIRRAIKSWKGPGVVEIRVSDCDLTEPRKVGE